MSGAPLIRPFALATGFLGAVCLGLLLYMGMVVEPRFHSLTGQVLPDLRLAGYEAGDVRALAALLEQRPQAASLLRGLHLLPDMIFPAAFVILSLMLLRRHAPGATVFHKPLTGIRYFVVLAAPVLYGIADYAENLASLALFAPAQPAAGQIELLAGILPLATRAKWMLFFVTLILAARFCLFRDTGSGKSAGNTQGRH